MTKSESLKDIKSLMERVRETTAKAQKPVEPTIPTLVVTPEQTEAPAPPADGPPPPPPPPPAPAPKAATPARRTLPENFL